MDTCTREGVTNLLMIKNIRIARSWKVIWSVGIAIALLLIVLGSLLMHQNTRAQSGTNGRLVAIHDRGEEKVLLSNAETVGQALADAGITLDSNDAVEPAVTQKLIASEYQVNIYRARPVTVVDGATREKIVTAYQTAGQIVKDVGITLYPEDTTAISRSNNMLADGAGLELKIERATAFQLNLYSSVSTARSQAATVGEMLKDKSIELGKNDRVSVPLSTAVTADMNVRVWREGKQTVTAEEAVDFETEQIRDADRDVGYKAVRTEGKNGTRSVTYEIEIKDGKVVSRVEIASIVVTASTKQVEVIGAKFKGSYTSPSENESITWSFLIGQGFTREQTAGIMGNLQQEHGFKTTGDGLAQWIGSRKARLMSRVDPLNINTQLDFMMEELNTGYRPTQNSIRASTTVKQSVIAFQDGYERCGTCMEDRRIQFAHNILASH